MVNTTKQIMILGAVLAVSAIVVASFFLGGAQDVQATTTNSITGNAPKILTNNGDENFQEVKLSFKNYEYRLEPSTLQKDVPVRMIVDLDTVYGCMRDVVISSFGVREYVSNKDNVIEFTPDKSGTFNIACSMNMGRGTFDVVDATGTKSAFVEEAPKVVANSGSSCSGGGSAGNVGGCGCGGA